MLKQGILFAAGSQGPSTSANACIMLRLHLPVCGSSTMGEHGWTWMNTMALNLSRGRPAASLCWDTRRWRLCKSCSESLTSRDASASRWNVWEKFTSYMNVSAEIWMSSLQLILYPMIFAQLCTWDHWACKCTPNCRLWLAYSGTFYFLPLLWTITTCSLWCQDAQLSRRGWRLPNLHAWSDQRWQAGWLQWAWLRRGAWARWHTATGLEDLFSLGNKSDEAIGRIRKKSPSQTNCFSRTAENMWKYVKTMYFLFVLYMYCTCDPMWSDVFIEGNPGIHRTWNWHFTRPRAFQELNKYT